MRNFSCYDAERFPRFEHATVHEALLHPNEAALTLLLPLSTYSLAVRLMQLLYLPPFWFHQVEALEESCSLSLWYPTKEYTAWQRAMVLPITLKAARHKT